MARAKIFFALIIVCLLTFILLYKKESKKFPYLFVVCTTTIIADTVKNIGAPYVTIKTLMGPGIDPHLYRSRESDVTTLSNADLIFYNGFHLEGRMGEIFRHMNRYVPTIAVAEAIPIEQRIASSFADIYDPHVWHDVALWRYVIPIIVNALSEKDPAHAAYYQENAAAYDKKLIELEQWVHQQIQRIPSHQRILVTAHDAFAYFGRAYGIQVIGLQGISTDAQVSAHDIRKTVNYIVQHAIPAIFLESSIPSQSIESVQRAVMARGWQVKIAPELFSDSLGDQDTTAQSYCGMIQCNTNTIVSALTQ